uniref:Uncharacterized protein n=1 Tax=Oryza glumipatula TaxID=40148 RepID=A0A0E0AFY8_9ORYZ
MDDGTSRRGGWVNVAEASSSQRDNFLPPPVEKSIAARWSDLSREVRIEEEGSDMWAKGISMKLGIKSRLGWKGTDTKATTNNDNLKH